MDPRLVLGAILAICILLTFVACIHSDDHATPDPHFEEYRRLNRQAQQQRYHRQHY